jgi:hypothetical protein
LHLPIEGEAKEIVNDLELPIGDRSPEVFRAVLEIPLDGHQKFEYDKQLHVFKRDRNRTRRSIRNCLKSMRFEGDGLQPVR